MPRRRVLIVDDQPLLCEFMAAAAQDAGWDARSIGDADAFEQALLGAHPDALALDLNMPNRDGVELLRYLALVRFRGKLLIISGCDEAIIESAYALAREHGLDVAGYLQKPILALRFKEMLTAV